MDWLLKIFIGAFGIWAGYTLAMKGIQNKQKVVAEQVPSEQEKIKEENKSKALELAGMRGRITNDEVEKLLGVSNATAERYLNELEKEGKLKQVGNTGKSVYYEKI